MPKASSKKPAKKPALKSVPTPEIPEDLKQKVSAIKALVSVHDLLNRGHFDGYLAPSLVASLKFIGALHTQMVAEAGEHELAYLVEELTQKAVK